MDKYASVNRMVMQLTDDESLRTFFTLYFMADEDDDAMRLKIEDDFMAELNKMPSDEKVHLKEKMRQTLRNAFTIACELREEVENYVTNQRHKKAA